MAVIKVPRWYQQVLLEERLLSEVIPEALCGEVPKGQSVIRGESLEVVCVEAPEGQPRNHRPYTRKPGKAPGEEPKRRGRRKGPPSSPWRKL